MEDDEQRDHGERRDHQQLVVVDVGDDLRLPRDDGIERGASGRGQRIPELCDRGIIERAGHCRDILRDVGVMDVSAAGTSELM